MGSNKISMAQFEDFPPTNRRHFGATSQAPRDQLGPGLTPKEEEKALPVSLNRSRVAHDGAEMQEDPNCFVSTAAKEAVAAASPMMSSYQAMQAGVSLDQKKRTGKRIVAQQAGGPPGTSLFFGGAPANRTEPEAALMLGTTKQSPHIPGYGGHIPKTSTAVDPAPVRTTEKTLVIENYKPYGQGYTGRKGY